MRKQIETKSSFAVFIVKDLIEAKTFYVENFNFKVVFENEWYLHLVSDSGVQVGFMLPNQPTQPKIFHKPYDGNGVIFSLEVEDAKKAYTIAKESALNIVLELKAEDWGQYHFCIEDPNGLYLDIVQTIEATQEYTSGYTD